VALVKALLRLFAWVYHGVLALFLLALSGLAIAADMHSLKLRMFPWEGESLTWWLLGLSLTALILVVLSIRRVARSVFFVWALAIFVFQAKIYIFSGYHFGGGDFRTALYLIAGAALATVGAWFSMRAVPARK
jgi:hypothetical protein